MGALVKGMGAGRLNRKAPAAMMKKHGGSSGTEPDYPGSSLGARIGRERHIGLHRDFGMADLGKKLIAAAMEGADVFGTAFQFAQGPAEDGDVLGQIGLIDKAIPATQPSTVLLW